MARIADSYKVGSDILIHARETSFSKAYVMEATVTSISKTGSVSVRAKDGGSLYDFAAKTGLVKGLVGPYYILPRAESLALAEEVARWNKSPEANHQAAVIGVLRAFPATSFTAAEVAAIANIVYGTMMSVANALDAIDRAVEKEFIVEGEPKANYASFRFNVD